MNADVVIVFLKAPDPGKVKTRLCPPLSAAQAAAVYKAFAKDTLESTRGVAGARSLLMYSPSRTFPDLAWLESPPPPFLPQRGETLGERLADSFRRAFSDGARKAVAIGSDSPHLKPRLLRRAFSLLDSRDLVLGPAEDGGYYLIGLSQPMDFLFEGIPWSTAGVYPATMSLAVERGLGIGTLPELFDVDTPADLLRLKAKAPPSTRLALRGLPKAALTALGAK